MKHPDLVEKFRTFLADKTYRITNQRLAIFQACTEVDGYFTAEELLDVARKIDRSVSRATIYRTIPILLESAMVREIDIGKDFKFYSLTNAKANEQAQVYCSDCEKIHEIDAPFLGWYGTSVSSKFGLKPVSQRLQITATCERLRTEGSCPKKTAETRN